MLLCVVSMNTPNDELSWKSCLNSNSQYIVVFFLTIYCFIDTNDVQHSQQHCCL